VSAAAGDHVLTGQSVSLISSSTLIGDVAATTVLTVGVSLPPADGAGEEAAATAVNDRQNPQFHQYYTPASWQQRFALPATASDPLVQRYTADGLQVVYSSPTRDFFDFTGTVAQIDQAFQVHIRSYTGALGGTFYANAEPPTVAAAVDAVTGLSDLAAHTGNQTLCSPGTSGMICVGTLEYTDLWAVYNLPPAITGVGQKIAIIGTGDSGGPTNDLHKYETDRHLPLVPTVCHPASGNNCLSTATADTGNEGEWALDSESSTAMAPSVTELDYYMTPGLGDAASFSLWANDSSGPLQGNASFGGCESLNAEIGVVIAQSPIFAQLAGEGRTLFASTGDTGGSCTVVTGNGIVNTIAPQVEWPAASRWVIGVGGTILYTDNNGHRATLPSGPGEFAWTHTGGGTSISQPEQPWQQPIGVVLGQCTINEDGTPRTSPVPCRGIPDVAAMSGDITVNAGGDSFADVEGGTDSGPGSDTADGGTSLSSPLWCGMWARMESASSTGSLGFAAPALYGIGLDPVKDVSDFYDVTQGDNGQFPAIARNNNPGAPDPSGWDYVSGFGTPDITRLVNDLVPGPGPQIPEAPAIPLLLLIPTGLVGIGSLARRRRRAMTG
jgi:subtilase family serine protease